MDVGFLIGRILFAVPFVLSGFTNHFSRQGVEYARGYGAPAPELMVPLSGVAIVAGGLSVALGIWADLGALVLAAFALLILPIMHAFWVFRLRTRCSAVPTDPRCCGSPPRGAAWIVFPIRAAPLAAPELNRPSAPAGRIGAA